MNASSDGLPAEAGHYEDAKGRHWLHQIYDGSAYGAPDRDVDQWLNPSGEIDNPMQFEENLPLVRLMPMVYLATHDAALTEKVRRETLEEAALAVESRDDGGRYDCPNTHGEALGEIIRALSTTPQERSK